MAPRQYSNFDLHVEAVPGAGYRARVTSCPAAEVPSIDFELPFGATELENLLLKLDPGRSGMRRVADPQTQAGMELGGQLFESIFNGSMLEAWTHSFDTARQAGEGLRVRVELTNAPEIAGLPWELLYDRRLNAFVAQSEKTPLVRYLDVPTPPRPFSVRGALRILAVIASPTDLPELDVEAEWHKLEDSLSETIGQGLVQLDRLAAPTIDDLRLWLRRNDVHVLHFVGHGDFDTDARDGVLWWCDKYGRRARVTSGVLGPYVRDHDPLRLVVLNACQSARVDTNDPFSGMAQGLIQQEATAVVAMQFPISDGAATVFTGEFYSSLADGLPVDQSVSSARKALLGTFQSEWATPVLFSRATDGNVFTELTATEPAVARPRAALAPPSGVVGRPRWKGRKVAIGTGTAVAVAASVTAIVLLSPHHSSNQPDVAVDPPTQSSLAVTAKHIGQPFAIDTNSDKWSGFPNVRVDKAVRQVSGAPELASDWTIGWDESALYFRAVVGDNELTVHDGAPAELFNGDSASFDLGPYIDEAHDSGAALDPKDVNVAIGPWERSSDAQRAQFAVIGADENNATFTGGPALEPNAIEARSTTWDTGYDVEARIPWSLMNVDSPHAGETFSFNVYVSDTDPGTGALRELASNNPNSDKNGSMARHLWGTLTLQ